MSKIFRAKNILDQKRFWVKNFGPEGLTSFPLVSFYQGCCSCSCDREKTKSTPSPRLWTLDWSLTKVFLTSYFRRITNAETNETRDVLHFHYTTWPDFGVPTCPDTFLEFLGAVRESGSLDKGVGPALVHCSAGIGRSGTFILVGKLKILN